MGDNDVQTATEGTEDDAEVRWTETFKRMVPTEIELTLPPIYADTSSTTKKP